MKNNKTTSASGGFCGLLTIAFIVLKLCKIIDWGWCWVLAPLWLPLVIAIVFLVIALIIFFWKKRK